MSQLDLDLPARPTPPEPKKWTEREVMELLHQRYSFVRPYTTARRYVVAEHISNTGGNWVHRIPERIADFIAVDLYHEETLPDGRKAGYGSHGLRRDGTHVQTIHGHEIKVSRSDWLAELKDPTKAQAWKQYCDKWWLVTSPGVAKKDELPDGWGLIEISPTGTLKIRRQAPLLTPEPMPKYVMLYLLRATQKTATNLGAPRD